MQEMFIIFVTYITFFEQNSKTVNNYGDRIRNGNNRGYHIYRED